jgi:outer membrane protein
MTSRFLSLLMCLSAFVAAPAFAELKIGVVDMQAVLKGTVSGKAAAKKFEDVRDRKKASLEKSGKDLQKREKTLIDKRNEIMAKAQELQGKPPGDDLKQRMAALEAEAKKFDADSMEFEMAKQKAVEELGHKEAELLRPIETLMKTKIDAIAKERALSLVLNKQVAVFAADALDITAEVIKRCDTP